MTINAYHENTSAAATAAVECQLHVNFNVIIKTKIE